MCVCVCALLYCRPRSERGTSRRDRCCALLNPPCRLTSCRAAFSSQAKERARDQLARRYRNRSLSDEDILHCLYSISDNNVRTAGSQRRCCGACCSWRLVGS